MTKKVPVYGIFPNFQLQEIFDNSALIQDLIKGVRPAGSYSKFKEKEGNVMTFHDKIMYKDDAFTLVNYYCEGNGFIIEVNFSEKNMNFAKEFMAEVEIYENEMSNSFDVVGIDISAYV